MITNSYDVLMLLWGAFFILAFCCFIYGMTRVFHREETRQDLLTAATHQSKGSPDQSS